MDADGCKRGNFANHGSRDMKLSSSLQLCDTALEKKMHGIMDVDYVQ